jgi:signal transduction histidine kinase
VVGSVLDYARPTKGDLGAVDVNAVVRRTLTVLASDRAEGWNVGVQLSEHLPLARADAEHLRQVLINLIRNAEQAMAHAGKVSLSTRLRQDRAAAQAGVEPVNWIEISVHDEGPGIAPHVLEQMFVPFFTTKAAGTGLGLAISQRVIEEMGGRIEVQSRPGTGSTFTVVLPLATEPASLARSSSEEKSPRAPTVAAQPIG